MPYYRSKELRFVFRPALFSYLNDEVLESSAILRSITGVALFDLLDGKHTKLVDALSALLHLLKADGITCARCFLSMLALHLLHILFVLLLSFIKLVLEEALRISLTLPLALEHDLEGALVSILAHHALQLKRVTVQLHRVCPCSFACTGCLLVIAFIKANYIIKNL